MRAYLFCLAQSLIGHWDVEITHAKMPGTVVRGDTSFEWIEGGRFVLQVCRSLSASSERVH